MFLVKGMIKYVKVLVSFLLIGILIYNVEWGKLIGNLESASTLSIIITLTIFTLQFPISTFKWQKSLIIHNLEYPFGFLQKVLCIAFFFNNFLPSSIGGDAYRAIKTMPKEGFRSRAVSAILLERIIGLFALVLLGFVGAIAITNDEHIAIVRFYILFCLAGGAAIIALMIILQLHILSGILSRISRIKKLEILTHNIKLVRRSPRMLLSILIVSLLFQLLAIVAIGVLFNTLGSDGGYAKYALIGAIAGIAGIIPISINGIGVVEGAFVVTAVQLGMDFSQSLIVAFMLRMLLLPLSLICGLVYLVDSHRSGAD